MPENLGGHMTLATPPFRKKIQGVMYKLSPGTRLSNFKSIPLTILVQLKFDVRKFKGPRDPGHALFRKIFKGHVWTVLGNMLVIFLVHIFNRTGAISN